VIEPEPFDTPIAVPAVIVVYENPPEELPTGICPLVGAVELPVPPDVTPSVPANVTTPDVAVDGVRPDNDVWNDVTPVFGIVIEPAAFETLTPVPAVNVASVYVPVLEPISN